MKQKKGRLPLFYWLLNMSVKKALIIAPPWVGDMVMTHSLIKQLKHNYPDCVIDVFAIPSLHPLIKRMAEVNQIISSPLKRGDIKLIERFKLGRQLSKNGYTHAYLIPNSFKSALVPFFAKIPNRVGFIGEKRYIVVNDIRKLDTQKLPMMVQRFVYLGLARDKTPVKESLQLPKLEVSPENAKQLLAKLGISLSGKPILAICPGPEHRESKRWPPEYFAKLATLKQQEGWDIWIFGGKKEQVLAEIIQKQSNQICLDLCGKTDLANTLDLLSLAKVVVANDSGLMHIASALHKPVVAIYGPTPVSVAPPLSSNKTKTISLNFSCSPCSGDTCPLKHNRCMTEITPEMLSVAISEIGN